jgi:NAD(P)H-dependent FMN reductase
MTEKITIIIGTNREGSVSGKIARQYSEILMSKGVKPKIIDLSSLAETFMFSELYGNRSEDFKSEIESKISSAEKFVFVIPEYNGGFPGALKVFIDAVPPAEWEGKKAGLVGVAAGRGGAARALDQFTNVLNYLKVNVLYSKPKFSGVGQLMNGDRLEQEDAINSLEAQAGLLIEF